MRILVVGDWHSELHEEAVFRALIDLGHEVSSFKWFSFFAPRPGIIGHIYHKLQRIQDKFVVGPLIGAINRKLLDRIREVTPESIFIYRGTHITSRTLRGIRKLVPGCVLVGYNNDDPFSPQQPKYLWRHFLHAVPEYDLIFAYRHHNIAEYRNAGARRVELLRSWFVPWRNRSINLSDTDASQFACDVVFVGHFEADQRLEFLEEVVRQGFSLRLFGPEKYWEAPLANSDVLCHLHPVRMVLGDEYNKALCGAKIALCFLSKLNRDSYTRRCFEIPATKTLMLSEWTEDLASLFSADEEVVFFSSKEEMIRKIRTLLKDEAKRRRIAEAGYRRVTRDGHDVVSRMETLLERVGEIRNEEGRDGNI